MVRGDVIIWLIVLMLSIFSLLAVYSSTGTLAYKTQAGNTEYYLFKHFVIIVFGLLLMYFAHRINYIYYSRIAQILLFISIPLLFITYIFGVDINEAKRWLVLPGTGLTFQTSDLAKLALIMYIARMLSKRQNVIKDFRKAFLPLAIAIILVCALIVPEDLSTGITLFVSSFLLMYIGRIKGKYLLLMFASIVLIFSLYIFLVSQLGTSGRVETWKARVENYVNDKEGTYQNKQAKIAIANGGLFGKGPGNSKQKNFLPNPYADFIYPIIIEEYGLLGGIFIILLYLLLLYRSIRIVIQSPKAFGALLAVGLATGLVLQAFVNMAVAVHLLPVTGLTLPLVSMGGSSLLFTSIAFGIILSVSRNIEENEEQKIESENIMAIA